MINNNEISSPFVVAILENYYNERPQTAYIDIAKLPEDNGYRRAVIDAINSEHKAVEVTYDTFGNYTKESLVKPKGVTIQYSVSFDENPSLEYDGYTIPEDWNDEDLAAWKEEQTNPTFDDFEKKLIAQLYHAKVISPELIAAQFNIPLEQIVAIGNEISCEDLEKDRAATKKMIDGFESLLG